MSLVGLIGRSDDWAVFSERWRDVLDIRPTVGSLHMNEAAHLEGDFKGWSADERDRRVRLLAEIVNDYALTALDCSVDVGAYHDEIVKTRPSDRRNPKSDRARVSNALDQPYFLCFHAMIMAACYELLDQGITDRFEIIFDENLTLGPRVRRWYPVFLAAMEDDERAIMPIEPTFRDDRDVLPLQTADLLAWLIRRERSGRSHSFDWIPNAMHGLVWSGHRQLFDRARLRGIREQSLGQSISTELVARTDRLLGLAEDESLRP